MISLLYRVLYGAVYAYMVAMAVYVLLSWFPNAQGTTLDRFLNRLIDPFLDIFRRFIPSFGGLDISPVIAFFVLTFLQRGLTWLFFMIVGGL